MSACAEVRRAEGAAEALLDAGHVICRGLLPAGLVRGIGTDLAGDFRDTAPSEGLFYGSGTVRFGSVLTRSRAAQTALSDPEVVALGEILLRWHQAIQLDFTQAIAVRPGARRQAPHRDGEMWPLPPGPGEHLVNLLFPLTRFTAENGATLVWPGSHRRPPSEQLGEPVVAVMEPGDVLAFLGSTLHCQGENRSGEVRSALAAGFSAGWLRSSENQILAYPPVVARQFPARLRELVGYRRLAPNLNNHDCRCPSELVAPRGGAVDELHPDQVQGLRRLFGDEVAAAR